MTNHAVSLLDHLQRARELLRDLNRSRLTSDLTQVAAGVEHELSAAEQVLRDLAGDALGNMDGKVRGDAPETGRQAARRVVLRTGTQRSAVLIALGAAHDGLTDFEVQAELGLAPSSERPRRGELVDAGLVEVAYSVDTHEPWTRVHNGNDWRVWQITPSGRLALDTIGTGEQMTFVLD